MPDFFLSRSVFSFSPGFKFGKGKESASQRRRDQEAKCGNKKGKGKKLKGKITPCFNVRRILLFRTFISPLTGFAIEEKGRKARKFSGFV